MSFTHEGHLEPQADLFLSRASLASVHIDLIVVVIGIIFIRDDVTFSRMGESYHLLLIFAGGYCLMFHNLDQ